MIRPVPMKRLRATVLASQTRQILRALGEMGTLELDPAHALDAEESALLTPRDQSAELARYDSLLARVETLRRALGLQPRDDPDPEQRRTTPATDTDQSDQLLRTLESRAESLFARRRQLEQQAADATAAAERLSPFHGIDLPPASTLTFLHYLAGTVAAEALPQLLAQPAPDALILDLGPRAGRHAVLALIGPTSRETFPSALRTADFRPEPIDAAPDETLSRAAHRARHSAAVASAELQSLDQQLASLADEARPSLDRIGRWAANQRRLCDAERACRSTAATTLLTGWVRSDESGPLALRLRQLTATRCALETEDAPDGDEVPVVLQENRLLRPFAALVKGYGLPRYGEVSPTPFLAVGALLMFGMMFGDVGHASVLALAGLAAVLAGRGPSVRQVGRLLLWAAAASALFGALYGSYFGLSSLRRLAFWRDPLEGDPLALMLLAISIGITVISLGVLLNIINLVRRRHWPAALMDKFGLAGLLFYWGALALLLNWNTLQSTGLAAWIASAVLGLPILAWLLRHPLETFLETRAPSPSRTASHAAPNPAPNPSPDTSWLTLLSESVVEAFEAVLVYLANTISFVRLAAYAMSHAALLMATLLMAEAVAQRMGLGRWAGLAILIIGNLVAIVLEGIIAAVQTLRLEYYEFFSKFFSGDGRPFRPFVLPGG